MNKISIGAASAVETKWQHLFLILEDDKGNPLQIIQGNVENKNPFRVATAKSGNLLAEIDKNVPETFNNSPQVINEIKSSNVDLNLNGRDADVVWGQMLQQAEQISDAKIPYDIDLINGESDNSNSFVNSILNSVGIDLQDVLPLLKLNNDIVPGSEDLFSEYADKLNVKLEGSNKADILSGGFGDDALFGGGGNDTLTGAVNLPFNDKNKYEVDVLTGGAGADLFILGDGKTIFYDNGQDFQENNGVIRNSPLPTVLDPLIEPNDFAFISDFNPAEADKIQLTGRADQYIFSTVRNDGVLSAIQNNNDLPKTGIYTEIASKLDPNLFSTSITRRDTGELIGILPDNVEGQLLSPGITINEQTYLPANYVNFV